MNLTAVALILTIIQSKQLPAQHYDFAAYKVESDPHLIFQVGHLTWSYFSTKTKKIMEFYKKMSGIYDFQGRE